MKTTILAAFLVGIAVAISDSEYRGFRAGNEYRYELNSQSLTGIPHLAAQFAGFRIHAQTKLQIGSRDRAVVKFDTVRFYTLNDGLEQLPTYEIVPDSKWQPVSGEQEQLYRECFQTSILFKYSQGIVSELQVSEEEPEWCTNLKKGVLSLFQMDLSQQNQIEDVEPALARIIHENQLSYDFKKMYRSMEESIDGNCESVYLVQEPTEHSQSYSKVDLEVTKIRNYDNCLIRLAAEEGVFSNYVVDIQNPHNQTGLRSICHTNATIRGDRRNFLIKDLKQMSNHFYTPLAEEDGAVAVLSVQELKFQDERQTESVTQPPSNSRRVEEGLKMKLSHKKMDKCAAGPNRQRVQVIEQILDEYVRQSSPVVKVEAMAILPKLMILLRDCSSEDIKEVIENLQPRRDQRQSQETPEQRKLKVLLDLVPTTGNPCILPVVKFLIQEQILTPLQAATTFNYIALTIKPTAEVVEYLLPQSELFRMSEVQSNSQLRRAILLACGTLQHGLTKAQKSEPCEQYEQIKKRFVTEIQAHYQSSQDESERITVLKTIGNCGLPDFFRFVQKVITTESAPLRIRMNAVFAFRRMPVELSQQIHPILVPIYQNNRNEYALRCVAYLGTIKSQPSYATVQAIVHNLLVEKSQKVGAFVYSHLQDVAQSSRLSFNETRHLVRILMKQAKPFFPEQIYSNSYSLDLLAKDLGIGQYLDVYIMDSEKSVFPSGFAGVWGQTLYGRETTLLEAGLDFTGVQEILNRLVGPKSILSDLLDDNNQLSMELVQIIKELLQPQESGAKDKIDQFVKDIIEKLGLTERQAEEFNLGAYMKVMGNELRLWLIQATDMKSWIEQNERAASEYILEFLTKLRDGVEINWMQTLTTETSIVIPTQLGIPMYFNGSYSHILRVTGTTKLNGNPFSKQSKDRVELELDIKPSAAVMIKESVGLRMPLLRCGVEVKSVLKAQTITPMRIAYQPQPVSLSVKYMIPQQQNEFIRVQAIPTTYITKFSSQPTPNVYDCQPKEIKNQKLIKPVTIEFKYECPTMGIVYQHQMEIPTPMQSFAPARPFNGRHEYVCITEGVSRDNQYVEFQIQYSSDNKYQYSSSSSKQGHYRSSPRSGESYDSYESSEEIISGEFRPVQRDPILQDPTKRVLTVQFQTLNTPKPITLVSQITLLTDEESKCQLNVQLMEDQSNYKGLSNIVVDLQKILYPKKDEPEQQLIAKIELGYGQQSFKENYGSVKIVTGDHSAKIEVPAEPLYTYKLRQFFNVKDMKINGQNIDMKQQSYLPFFGQYGDEQDQVFTRATVQMPEARSYAYKYTMQIDYEQLPESVQEYAQYLYQYAKNMSQEYVADIPKESQQNARGPFNVYVRLMPSLERLHLLLDTPNSNYQTVVYCPARLPPYLKRALTLDSDLLLVSDSRSGKLQGSDYSDKAACIIEKQSSDKTKVKTFDSMTYDLPQLPDDCEVVLAQECTQNPLFLVLMSQQYNSKKITIGLPGHKIQLLVSQGSGSRVQLKINDNDIQLNEGQQETIRLDINKKSVQVKCIKKTGNTIAVEINELGLNVAVDQQKIRIQTSPMHSGKMCGLCGDYNGDVLKEMTGPREELYRDHKAFGFSYVVSSNKCNVPQLMERHNVQRESCSIQRRTIEPRNPPAGETCQSIDAVNVCPRNCQPVNERTQQISFRCRREQYPYDSHIVRQQVSIPERCEPRY